MLCGIFFLIFLIRKVTTDTLLLLYLTPNQLISFVSNKSRNAGVYPVLYPLGFGVVEVSENIAIIVVEIGKYIFLEFLFYLLHSLFVAEVHSPGFR